MEADRTDLDAFFFERIEDYRKKLLNLSLRNSLLNFKITSRRRSYLRLVDTTPDLFLSAIKQGFLELTPLPPLDNTPEDEKTSVFINALDNAHLADIYYLRSLSELDKATEEFEEEELEKKRNEIELRLIERVRRDLGLPPRRQAQYPSLNEWARRHGINPNFDLPAKPETLVPDVRARLLQTKLFREDLEKTLDNLRQIGRKSEQELGINTMYAAIGFLEWYESDASDRVIHSPLLLHPVKFERQTRNNRISQLITSLEEETETNYTLIKKMQEFGLSLPAYDGEKYNGFEAYLKEIIEIISYRSRWKVRRFITVAPFQFAQLVLYQDLDSRKNPQLTKHNVIKDLLVGSKSSGLEVASIYDVDKPEIAKELKPLLYDADSSQLSAIKDVLDGRNLVIKGPPGTGKSQTITNIIAALMARGKSVLFVAEKSAALDVVKTKLEKAGLGDFCLALHSAKTTRADALRSFRGRLELSQKRKAPIDIHEKRLELEGIRERLNHYASTMAKTQSSLGKTIHELIWALQQYEVKGPLPETLKYVSSTKIEHLTHVDIARIEQKFAEFDDFSKAVLNTWGSVERHPWYGLAAHHLNRFNQNDLVNVLKGFVGTLENFCANLETTVDIPELHTLQDVVHLTRHHKSLTDLPEDIKPKWLLTLKKSAGSEAAQRFIQDLETFQTLNMQLMSVFAPRSSRRQVDAKQLMEYVQLAKEHGLEKLSLHELEKLYEKDAAMKVFLDKLIATLERVVSLLKLSKDYLKYELVVKITDTFDFLSQVPQNLLAARMPIIFQGDCEALLDDLHAEQEKLTEYFSKRNQSYYDLASLDPQPLFDAANVLASAGAFARFKANFRQAKTTFNTYLSRSRASTNKERAASLTKFAVYLQRAHAFNSNQDLERLAGPYFAGFHTNLNQLIEVCAFGNNVKKRFTQATPLSEAISNFLLYAPLADIEHFQFIEAELMPWFEELEKSSMKLEANFYEIRKSLETGLAIKMELLEYLRSLDFKNTVILNDLEMLPEQIQHYSRIRQSIEANTVVKTLLADSFLGSRTDIRELKRHLHCIVDFMAIPEYAWNLLERDNWREQSQKLDDSIQSIDQAYRKIKMQWQDLSNNTEVDEQKLFAKVLDATDLKDMLGRLKACLKNENALPSLVSFQLSKNYLQNEVVIQELIENGQDLFSLAKYFSHFIYYTLVRDAMQQNPVLGEFRGRTQENLQKRFRKLDKEITELERLELVNTLLQKKLPFGSAYGRVRDYTELAAIRHQVGLDRPSMPIRQLLAQAPQAAMALKPCFLMSPLSVGMYLRTDKYVFDVVLIDEASQMLPEDALSAILRGKQLVVVGDPQQLPPTSFFTTIMSADQEEEDIPADSILELASTRYQPLRELLFHYRSRHESLIAFSNKEFYEDRLIVFPSPLQKQEFSGVKSVYVQGQYRTGTGLNIPEAETLIAEAVSFMQNQPDRSLGIATVNQKQAEFIQQRFEQLYQSDYKVETYMDKWQDQLESFFVKNLENVQGDERDAIFVSTVYGPDQSGRVHQRFGPINSQTGHRRLNVLFTRAKHHVRLFTSLKQMDITPSEQSHRGVHVLQNYLAYASSGRLHLGTMTEQEPDSDFERFVLSQLREAGFNAVCQVGVAGFRIDLGVQHPNNSNIFILGVECDGASYHSSRSARDRDRIRQEILEGLGWDIYRIWSTDWFANPKDEFEKLRKYIESLLESKYQEAEIKCYEESS